MEPTRELARFAAETTFAGLRSAVVEAMKVYILDDIACGFAGSAQPWAKIVTGLVQSSGGREDASVFTQPWRTTAGQAALVNGVMIGGFESEHVGHNAHPSGTVFPAAFALAERERASGAEFLTALAIGYEVVCRIGDAQTDAVEIERGIHNPAANGPFGAAAAAGRLLGLDADTLASALGIGGSHCGGLTEYAWDGTMTKRLHLGRAAQLGLESALLASAGFTGPATILEGRHGYFHAYSPAPRLELLLEGLGTDWRLLNLTIKAYPSHVTSQPFVAAIQQLKRSGVVPEDMKSAHIRAGERLLQPRFLNQAPDTMLGAQYSLPYTIAVAVHRDLDDPLSFDESVLSDPRIRRLASAITWEAVSVADRAAEMSIGVRHKLHTVQVGSFRGAAGDPLDFAGAADKFRRFTTRFLNGDQQTAIIDAVRRVIDLPDVSVLAAMIRGRGERSEGS